MNVEGRMRNLIIKLSDLIIKALDAIPYDLEYESDYFTGRIHWLSFRIVRKK